MEVEAALSTSPARLRYPSWLAPWWALLAGLVTAATLERQVLWTVIRDTLHLSSGPLTALSYLACLLGVEALHLITMRFSRSSKPWPMHFVAVFAGYGAFSFLRNSLGSTRGLTAPALSHARSIVRLEEWLHIAIEPAVQRAFYSLPHEVVFKVFGTWYTLAHAGGMALMLVFLFRSSPTRYARALFTLATASVLALLLFKFVPTMPPRLLAEHDATYRMLDPLASSSEVRSEALEKVSNQYAALPSMHCAWAFLVCVSLWHSRRWRPIAAFHFAFTALIVVATGHHFVIDIAAGVAAMALGHFAYGLFSRLVLRQRGDS